VSSDANGLVAVGVGAVTEQTSDFPPALTAPNARPEFPSPPCTLVRLGM
jgi:hypothetical protein